MLNGMPAPRSRRIVSVGFGLFLTVFGPGCHKAEHPLQNRFPRVGLARFSVGQAFAPCFWTEPPVGEQLSAPHCGGKQPLETTAPLVLPAPNTFRRAAPATESLQRGRWRVLTAVDVRSLAQGIEDLKHARSVHVPDADIENDFIASFLRLAELGDDSYSLFFGLERLLAEIPETPRHPELLFNRAVAWDLLGVTDESFNSWKKFLAVEDESPWSDEARGRIDTLMKRAAERRGGAAAWDPSQLSAAREHIFEQLLLTWAEAVLRGEPAAAEPALGEAEAIARATGDRLSLASISLLHSVDTPNGKRKRRALAEAHRRLAQGIASRRRFVTDEATTALSAASRRLTEFGSPAALLADYQRALAIYHSDRYPEAEALLAKVHAAAAKHDEPLVCGLSAKALGLIAQVTGRPEVATAFYREALADVDRSGDLRERTNVASILADGLLAAGRDKEAWRILHGALRSAWQHSDTQPRYVVSAAGAAMAEKRGFTHLASAMTRLSLAAIRGAGSPAAIADSATWYADTLIAIGRLEEAGAVLRQVRPLIDQLDDEATLRRARADLDCAEGRQLLTEGQAEAALPRLRRAADYYEGVSLLTHAAPCRAGEGAALLARGKTIAAGEVLERSLILASHLDGFLPHAETYYGASDPTVSLLESTLALYIEQGKPWEALRIAALALQRTSPGPRGNEPWKSGQPPAARDLQVAARSLIASKQVVLIVYPLPHGVIAWRLDGKSIAVHRATAGQRQVSMAVDRFLATIQRGNVIDADAPQPALGTVLLGSLLRDVARDATLIVVSTADLAALPWGFLKVPGSGERLISKWPIALAPDLRVALAPARASPAVSIELLAVANPSIPMDVEAPPLPHAEEEVAMLLRLFPGRALALVGERATKRLVLERIGQAASVHLAMHGVSDIQTPRASHLVMRGADGSRDSLTVDEILGLDLRSARVVVLASCKSSFRSTALATNAFGLGEAFLAAGAHAVVASGWAVDDAATEGLMGTFYRALADGAGVAEALRHAQLTELVRAPDHLRDFAAFRVLGDPDATLNSTQRSSVQ